VTYQIEFQESIAGIQSVSQHSDRDITYKLENANKILNQFESNTDLQVRFKKLVAVSQTDNTTQKRIGNAAAAASSGKNTAPAGDSKKKGNQNNQHGKGGKKQGHNKSKKK
jgi:uncharacterized protein YdeI (YjbR/CyaY-like superfamily)